MLSENKIYQLLISLLISFGGLRYAYIYFQKSIKKLLWLKRYGTFASGIIIDVKEDKDGDGQKYYLPVLRFLAKDDNSYTFTSIETKYEKPDIGKQVEVLYDLENPNYVEIYNEKLLSKHKVVLIFIILVFVFIWVAFFCF